MTCIVAIVDPLTGVVTMGGDSAGSNYDTIRNLESPKVFRNGEALIGYTSSFRFGQLLEHALELPTRNEGETDLGYLSTTFANQLRQSLKDGGWNRLDDGVEEGGTFLLGYRGSLYEVQGDFSVLKYADCVASCGSGGTVALAALVALKNHLSVREAARHALIVERALTIASEITPYVRPPFTILTMGRDK